MSLPLPKFTGIELPEPPKIQNTNPFDELDDFDDFISATTP